MSKPTLAITPPTLFRNNHNVPLKCFIQADIPADKAAEMKNLLETHGADVSTYLQHALVILVDPPTQYGQLLIRDFGNDTNRAILDLGWVRECIHKGRCIGPSENWGGHRLPVVSINDFFSYDAPPITSANHTTYGAGSYSPQSPYHKQSSVNIHPTGALPSPAISQSLPPSPVLTHKDRGDASADGPTQPSSTADASRGPSDSSPDDPEPQPPGVGAMVLHHNGMGAKFTDLDVGYVRKYFAWSQKHFPERTHRQTLYKIHEKMPYHSVNSTTQYMRRHPEAFPEVKKFEDIEEVAPKKRPRQSYKDAHPDVSYDPGSLDDNEPPKPPTQLVPFAKGYRFTTADDEFLIAYFNWYGKRYPSATKGEILRQLAKTATYRSVPSWAAYLHKNSAKWKDRIPLFRDDDMDDPSISFQHEDATTEDIKAESDREPESEDEPDIDLADARRWNPPRRSSLVKPLTVPIPADEDDASYGEPERDPERKPASPKAPRTIINDFAPPKRRRTEGHRRRSTAFTEQERQGFIDFLSQHPWVWTTVSVPQPWLHGSTTASAVWQKFERIQPQRSAASWREFHKRNALEFDAEAKQLYLLRLEGKAPPLSGPALGLLDVGSTDGHQTDDQSAVEHEEPASSFSYAPLPPQPDSEDEEDQLRTDDDETESVMHDGHSEFAATRAPRKIMRNGRAYLPFTPEQKEAFMIFLMDNPHVWTGATPDRSWISWEQSHEGKDTTWKRLASMPGMDNHSYKSWREYHRARALQVDPIAMKRRLARDAAEGVKITIEAPTLELPEQSTMHKRSRSLGSEMDLSLTPLSKKNKLEEMEDLLG